MESLQLWQRGLFVKDVLKYQKEFWNQIYDQVVFVKTF